MDIGERIKQKREAKGLTKVDLAKQAKVSHIQLAKYENNESRPSTTIIRNLANVLDTTTDYLIQGIEPKGLVYNDAKYTDYLERAKKFLL